MPSKIYKYYPVKEGRLACIVCDYPYALDAPLSTLKKHIRVKHNFSIRKPPTSQQLIKSDCGIGYPYYISEHVHTRIDIKSLLNPVPEPHKEYNYTYDHHPPTPYSDFFYSS
ncbi:hypothetical protein DSO57_1027548 [Entomophthora muscae]|uniref:Uncharacterized protein n=3 Tax=Entomophthora muscae TaxID=34485 RepID=A0ACC2T1P5_9FUNG|nr:hypothetical protein DSO57_1028216 [Entomophthora muscae]KAJ9076299.1 hypothetical protein DSO57_1027547 [Entomophthora muscae]KAJ9076300.1 hypothetical protein DSO57_1027548 [Entomophthora muscae]